MLSNFNYYDSCGSDRSDNSFSPLAQQQSLPIDDSSLDIITTDTDLSLRVIDSEHDYQLKSRRNIINTNKTAANRQTISRYLNSFDPFMANNTTELFGELSDNFFNYNDYSDDFANAPTPFIAYTDLNDIDTDDLVGIDNKRNIDTNNNSNNEIINLDFSINPNDSSYCVAIDEPMVTVESGTIDDQLQDVKHLECSTRKRRISYVDDDGEDSDVDSDNASIATAVTGKPKAKVGRKPSGVNKCMSRNAIAARENREKKKRESEDMRRKLNIALKDNKEKDSIIVDLRVNVAEKDKRIGYLEGLLANDSAIAAIIKHMSNVPTVQLIGSHFQSTDEPVLQKSDKMLDDKSVRKSTRIAAKGESAGICFHVNNNRMSLELCRKCSDSAKRHNKKGK